MKNLNNVIVFHKPSNEILEVIKDYGNGELMFDNGVLGRDDDVVVFEEQDPIELVLWESVRRDCKYPKEDNNKGYTYGINFLGNEYSGHVVDVQWFKTHEERDKYIVDNDLIVVNETTL